VVQWIGLVRIRVEVELAQVGPVHVRPVESM
jgi:hypothetical protein